MTEKKIQENPLPESVCDVGGGGGGGGGATAAQVQMCVGGPLGGGGGGKVEGAGGAAGPMPDLYRKLLPAALFLLTFVTVMTVLLVYMDTTAVGAQQFRLNMTRDYELSRIAADDPALISYIKQRHMSLAAAGPDVGVGVGESGGPAGLAEGQVPPADDRVLAIHRLSGYKRGGRYLAVVGSAGAQGESGAGEAARAARWLGAARGWRGVLALADPRAYLAQRPRARARPAPPAPPAAPAASALHAALSPHLHPREVSYFEEGGFNSRVLCLPLTTLLLLTADVTGRQEQGQGQGQLDEPLVDYVVIESPQVHQALANTPRLPVQVLELRAPDDEERARSTALLRRRGFRLHVETAHYALYSRSNDTAPTSTAAPAPATATQPAPDSAPELPAQEPQ